MMNREEELNRIERLCVDLGSEPDQARRMASQLVKRADQWVEEKGMDRVEAMKRLLEMVVMGRQGVVPPGISGQNEEEGKECP
jgi:hypothetical protein